MYIFLTGLFLTLIGIFMTTRGNTSRFSTPSGGGSRIPPEAQSRLNDSIQRVAGSKETYDQYYKESNSFRPKLPGMIALIVGVALMVLSYFVNI